MIRQRGSSWQVDVTVDGKRIRKSVRTYAEANELELKLEGSNKIIKPIRNQRPKVKIEKRKKKSNFYRLSTDNERHVGTDMASILDS